jgi:hypothetical protein
MANGRKLNSRGDWHEVAKWLHNEKSWTVYEIANLFGKNEYTVFGVLNGNAKTKHQHNPEKYNPEYFRRNMKRSSIKKKKIKLIESYRRKYNV